MDEFRLIRELFAPLAAGYPGALDLKDDAALVTPRVGHQVVVTCDALVAGVHFLKDDPPELIARKAVRVNLSDLAAMGASPIGLVLALALPKDADEAFVRRFAAGLAQDVALFNVPLIGGDTVATPGPFTLAITALGEVPAGAALRRSTARPGDLVFVSGTIGDGALGLAAAQGKLTHLAPSEQAFLADRYRLPQPRTILGPSLVGLAHAAMDVSDGLVQDLGHIASASGIAIEVRVEDIPLSSAVRFAITAEPAWLASVLTGGDDYELIFTAAEKEAAAIEVAAGRAGIQVTRIGQVAHGKGVIVLRDGHPMDLRLSGYRHFSDDDGRAE
jgi:thiamine-monophosphate kinase